MLAMLMPWAARYRAEGAPPCDDFTGAGASLSPCGSWDARSEIIDAKSRPCTAAEGRAVCARAPASSPSSSLSLSLWKVGTGGLGTNALLAGPDGLPWRAWGAGCIPWRCAAEVSYCPCPRAGGARSGCEGTKAACMVAWEGGEGSSSKLSSPLSACALAKVNGLLAAPGLGTIEGTGFGGSTSLAGGWSAPDTGATAACLAPGPVLEGGRRAGGIAREGAAATSTGLPNKLRCGCVSASEGW
mmetsp:Transcript_16385/g.31446  ORF Transcript_16385/g.31446 Transcript_16385/m.31446 type:complete len:243 (+) Transcript_16385:1168-1896(+)